eukprot:11221831-Lingulodinium_polyedra.AAC.1
MSSIIALSTSPFARARPQFVAEHRVQTAEGLQARETWPVLCCQRTEARATLRSSRWPVPHEV